MMNQRSSKNVTLFLCKVYRKKCPHICLFDSVLFVCSPFWKIGLLFMFKKHPVCCCPLLMEIMIGAQEV